MTKPKLATASLAGCFGCHMSILDMDERLLDVVELIDFDKSPVDDIKEVLLALSRGAFDVDIDAMLTGDAEHVVFVARR